MKRNEDPSSPEDIVIFDGPKQRNLSRFDDEDPEEAALKYYGPHRPAEHIKDGNRVRTHHSARGNLKVISIQGPSDEAEKTLKPKPKAPRAKSKTTPKDPKITKAHKESLKEIGLNLPKSDS